MILNIKNAILENLMKNILIMYQLLEFLQKHHLVLAEKKKTNLEDWHILELEQKTL